MSNHPIVHVEFAANDQTKAGKFYSDLFGWEMQYFEAFDYTTFRASPEVGGGINTASADNPIGKVVFYVATDDIDASLAKAESMGAKTIMPKDEVPGMGWLAVFLDPDGNQIGLWTAAPMQS